MKKLLRKILFWLTDLTYDQETVDSYGNRVTLYYVTAKEDISKDIFSRIAVNTLKSDIEDVVSETLKREIAYGQLSDIKNFAKKKK